MAARTLIIGTEKRFAAQRQVPWAEVPLGLPSAFQFSLILVVPEADTLKQQEQVRDLLKQDLEGRPAGSTRVVWVLNENCLPSLAGDLGIGNLIPLRELIGGKVRSLVPKLPVDSTQLKFGIDRISMKVQELAYWEREDRRSRFTLAAASSEGRWILYPILGNYENLYDQIRLGPNPVASIIVAALILLSIAIVGFVAYQKTNQEYRRAVWNLGNINFLPFPAVDQDLDSKWLTPEARMARRILQKYRNELALIAKGLAPGKSAFELWKSESQKRGAYEGESFIALALLGGDLSSVYRVADAWQPDWYKSRIMQFLTTTFWQTANEYLYELDFQRAYQYNEMYLKLSRLLLRNTSDFYDLGPERNRTLAYILQREFSSPRIRSLCEDPDAVTESFGRLLKKAGGSSLPDSPEGLAEKRAQNSGSNCAGLENHVDYRLLKNLKEPTRHSEELCKIAPLECRYVRIVGAFTDERNLDPARFDQRLVRQSIEFAKVCSYLSDDALWWAFHYAMTNGGNRLLMPVFQLSDLAPIFACVESSSADMAAMLAEQLGKLPCSLVGSVTAEARATLQRSSLLDNLLARCQEG